MFICSSYLYVCRDKGCRFEYGKCGVLVSVVVKGIIIVTTLLNVLETESRVALVDEYIPLNKFIPSKNDIFILVLTYI